MNAIHKAISWIRWGRLQEKVTDRMEGIVIEYAVVSTRSGVTVGYWAHGYFDQRMPYCGQPAFWR